MVGVFEWKGVVWGICSIFVVILVVSIDDVIGKKWIVRPIILAIVLVGVATYVFPIHHGDGRSNAYNDGWGWVAQVPASTALQFWGTSGKCAEVYHANNGFATPSELGFPASPPDNRKEWLHGCRDALAEARAALANARSVVTIPKTP